MTKIWWMTKPGRDCWIAYYPQVMRDAVRDGWEATERVIIYGDNFD